MTNNQLICRNYNEMVIGQLFREKLVFFLKTGPLHILDIQLKGIAKQKYLTH